MSTPRTTPAPGAAHGDGRAVPASVMGEPSADGRFGEFGGRFVPESLIPACMELEDAFRAAWADPGFHAEAQAILARLRRPAHAGHRVPPPVGATGRARPAQARGPDPHRVAQAQQRDRPGPAGPADGQAAPHRRDRRGPARRGGGHGGGAVRHGLRRVHGRARHRAPGAQRVPHGAARCRGAPGAGRKPHPQGRRERGLAGLGGERGGHPLLPRVGDGAPPLSVDGARVPARGGRRGPRSSAGPCSTGPTPTGWWPVSAAGRTRRGPSPGSSTPPPRSWEWRRPAAPPWAGACPASCTG